ncbi:MAG TPA: succinate dehydrogenase, cytochrome b556 subunit [Burkholderiaceae bacterium]
MTDDVKKSRPEFRNIHVFENLPNYRLPLAGFVSILHRISGLLMFLLLPFILCVLDRSLRSADSFNSIHDILSPWYVKLVILALSWAYLHHFCAGVRHLFMDMHYALDKDTARRTSAAVFVISLPLAALVGLKLFGVF